MRNCERCREPFIRGDRRNWPISERLNPDLYCSVCFFFLLDGCPVPARWDDVVHTASEYPHGRLKAVYRASFERTSKAEQRARLEEPNE